MAIPELLYKIEVTFSFRVGQDMFGEPFDFSASNVWFAMASATLDTPNGTENCAEAFRNRLAQQGVQQEFACFGEWVYATRWACRDVAFTHGSVHQGEEVVGPWAQAGTLPPQTALLVFGRTDRVGTQTRKWLPFPARDLLGTRRPKFFDDGARADLSQWAWDQLRPLTFFTGLGQQRVMTPVCWDPVVEEVLEIRSIHYHAWPRTIRRRVLDTEDALITDGRPL